MENSFEVYFWGVNSKAAWQGEVRTEATSTTYKGAALALPLRSLPGSRSPSQPVGQWEGPGARASHSSRSRREVCSSLPAPEPLPHDHAPHFHSVTEPFMPSLVWVSARPFGD